MDSISRRNASVRPLPAVLLACALSWAAGTARAQTASTGPGRPTDRTAGAGADADAKSPAKDGADGKPDRKVAGTKKAGGAAPAGARERGHQPSEEYQESIRKTVEKRRQRRARRAQAPGSEDSRPIGAIVPWPMPPALIIRHTPQVHDEVGSLLDLLRK